MSIATLPLSSTVHARDTRREFASVSHSHLIGLYHMAVVTTKWLISTDDANKGMNDSFHIRIVITIQHFQY